MTLPGHFVTTDHHITTTGDEPTRPWLAPDIDNERIWLVWGTRKIAFVRLETVRQLVALNNGFGARELIPFERLSVHR